MRALDLLEHHPMVSTTTDAREAVRLMVDRELPALVVRGDGKRPYSVLPAHLVMSFIVPEYAKDNPALARVVDEKTADTIARALDGKTVGDLLPHRDHLTAVSRVNHDDTVLEVAAVMAGSRSPLVVVGRGDEIIGVVTARRLLGVLFPTAGDAQTDASAADRTP
ncbi:MAG: CBS domain-containing protein [Actinomycetota bacterium]|nr:CBS domain-containing protein [Actinomycetota bacterium]